jgi:CheY-like chemotaxis protein
MDHTTSNLPEQRLRALVLDDDAAALHDLRRSLEARHYAVLASADGKSGLDLLLDELLDLDVLVTDMDLPHRDARSFADLIRRAGGERDLAIVVLVAEAAPACRADLLALGVDAVVDRAAGLEAVAAAVDEVVAGRRRSNVPASEPPRSPHDSASPDPDVRWSLAFGRWSLLPV